MIDMEMEVRLEKLHGTEEVIFVFWSEKIYHNRYCGERFL